MSRIRRLAKFRNKRTAYEAPKFGFNPHLDEGTDGDWFVDGINGNDLNNGTSIQTAFKTIGKAVSVMSGGQVVRIAAGTYREAVNLSSKGGTLLDPTVISGYGNQKPVITGADVITGWTQCTISDIAQVGQNYSNIYKVTIPTANIAGSGGTDPRGVFLHEDGKMMIIASERVLDPKYPMQESATSQFLIADVVNTSGGLITSLQKRSVTDKYTKSQLEKANIWLHYYPNLNARSAITFDDVNHLIIPTNQSLQYESNSNKNRFSLVNILPNIALGEYGYITEGANTTIYVWPKNIANLESRMEYSARTQGLIFGQTTSYVQCKNLIIKQTASPGVPSDTLYAISAGNTSGVKNNLVFFNILIENTYRTDGGYGAISTYSVNNLVIKNVTVKNAINQFGISVSGDASGALVESIVVEGSGSAPLRIYNQVNMVAAFLRSRDCGLTAHSNKSNAYLGCHNVLWYGVDFSGASGYLTWQDASAISIVNCYVPVNYLGADGRAITDQNRRFKSPAELQTLDSTGYILNNTVVPYKDALSLTNSLTLGADSDSPVSISGIVGNGTTATVTTLKAHLIATGKSIRIVGTTNFNGIFTATSTGTYTFTISSNSTATDSTAGQVWLNNISSIVGNGTTATVNSTGHGFSVGHFMTIANSTNFNGTYEIKTVTTNSFTIDHPYNGTNNDCSWYWSRQVLYKVYNNILHGATTVKQQYITGWANNILTSGGVTYHASDVSTTIAAMYENPSTGNFTYKSDAPILGLTGKDLTTEINLLKSIYPQFTGWNFDVNKNPNMNWASPKLGCFVNYSDNLNNTPVWSDYPILNGSAFLSEPFNISSGFLISKPYPIWNYQWQSSADRINWDDISGQTSSTYTISNNETNRYIGCLITSGSIKKRISNENKIVGNHPIGTPIILSSNTNSTGIGSNFETSTFSTDGSSLIVSIAIQGSSAGNAPVITATLGNNGRSYGTGTALSLIASHRRSRSNLHWFLIQNPGTTSGQTVQFQVTVDGSASVPTSWKCEVIKISGIISVGAATKLDATAGNSINPSVNVTTYASKILYGVVRYYNTGDSISSSKTLISSGNTGGTNTSNNALVSLSIESADSINYTKLCDFSWTNATTYAAMAIELKSA